MNAAEIVESLFKLGVTVREGFMSARHDDGSVDWEKFLKSEEFKDIEGQAKDLLHGLNASSISGAVKTIDDKSSALKKGRKVSALSPDELHQLSSLLDVRSVLVQQQLKHAAVSAGFFQWLVETALPTLAPIVSTVLKLLL